MYVLKNKYIVWRFPDKDTRAPVIIPLVILFLVNVVLEKRFIPIDTERQNVKENIVAIIKLYET